jgi:acyl transferase domain-containing protein/acyl carrier protein
VERDDLEPWLVDLIAARLAILPSRVDVTRPLADLGLSSEQTVEIAAILEDRLGRNLGAELLYRHPTISALVAHLTGVEPDAAPRHGPTAPVEPIAIVGIGCRFPGSGPGPQAFWEFLAAGGDAIRDVPAQRWNAEEIYDPDPSTPGTSCSRRGAFLDDIETFDAVAFGIGPAEAAQMDPQQRLLLEATWHAIEDSGVAPPSLAGGRTGVFIGLSQSEYARGRFDDLAKLDATTPSGTALSIAANRISYVFDLHGPSVTVDTACSSSLMAVHLACRSLRSGEACLALAGGANVLLSPDVSVAFSRAGLMSPDGRCKAFDDSANGYVRGEGAGMVVLKRLADALADGDAIYAEILGTATVQDGRSNGLMAPRGSAQEAVLAAACQEAGVPPGAIQYVEAHGTGTALGDVIEATALGRVVGRREPGQEPCALGSVKTNIGHLEAAAGVAGLIKTALCLHHGALPPSLHFQKPNHQIDFAALGLEVNGAPRPWPATGRRLAGVSSFGFGGTNVHCVLGEASSAQQVTPPAAAMVLGLSAHDPDSLRELSTDYIARLESVAAPEGVRLVHATSRRTRLSARLAVSGGSPAEVAANLRRKLQFESGESPGAGRPGKTAFVFTGQGAIWPGAGRDLFECNPIFRDSLLECDAHLRDALGTSVLPALFSDDAEGLLARTEWAQPALFALQIALSSVLVDWGVRPDAVVGHSAGELAAACVGGQLSLAAGARLIVRRSQFMEPTAGRGKMVLVVGDRDAIDPAIAGMSVSVAAINAENSIVMSGETAMIDEAVARLSAAGLVTHPLLVNYGFHSPLMDEAAGRMALEALDLPVETAACSYYSAARGAALPPGARLDAAYWAENIRSPVLFRDAFLAMVRDDCDVFVEIGPHPALLRDMKSMLPPLEGSRRTTATLRRDTPGRESLAAAAAQLFAAGALRSLDRVAEGSSRFLSAPPLPWARRVRHWIDRRASGLPMRRISFLGRPIEPAFDASQRIWEGELDLTASPELGDHRVLDQIVAPAAAYIDMLLRAAGDFFGDSPFVLEDVQFLRLLILSSKAATALQVLGQQDGDDLVTLTIFARLGAESWTAAARATARRSEAADLPPIVSPDAISARCFDRYPGPFYYDLLKRKGLDYGPRFRRLTDVQARRGEALGRFRATPARPIAEARHVARPDLVDGSFHVMAAAFGAKELMADTGAFFLPESIERIVVHNSVAPVVWSHCRMLQDSGGDATADITMLDAEGRAVIAFAGFKVRGSRAQVAHEQSMDVALSTWLHDVRWIPAPEPAAAPSGAPSSALLFCDDGGTGDALAAIWSAAGAHCLRVRAGRRFKRISADELVVDPASLDDLRRAVDEAPEGGWATIIHLSALSTAVSPEAAVTLGPASLAGLIQAIETSRAPGRPTLTLVTRGATAAAGAIVRDPLQAMTWGLARAAVFEHPNLGLRRIDLDPDSATAAETPERLSRELQAPDLEDQVALRGSERMVARLRQIAIAPRAPTVRLDATYLITGGSGALAGHVARTLGQLGAGVVVLVSRKGGGDGEWREDLDSLPGVRVLRVACDVADATQMRALMERLHGLPPLRGIVHAAGVLADGTILKLDRSALDRVLAPKVLGARNLATIAAAHDLDFFVLFSSAASVLGSPGQASYCAANAYLDALAHAERAAGRPAMSISWGAWLGEGMAQAKDETSSLVSSGLISMIPPEVGADLFGRLLGSGLTHVAVLPFSVRSLVQFYPSNAGLNYFSDLIPNAAAVRSDGAREAIRSRPDIETVFVAPRNEIETAVAGMWQRAIGMTGIGVQDELFALGGDSVFASQILSQMNQTFGVRINPEDAFDAFTVERLAELVEAEFVRQIDTLDDSEVERLLGGKAPVTIQPADAAE